MRLNVSAAVVLLYKVSGFLPGVIFCPEINISGLLMCPIFRVSSSWISSRPWRWDAQVVPKSWFLTKKWRQVKTQKVLYSFTLSLTYVLDKGWVINATPPPRFTLGKESQYPFYRVLGGPRVASCSRFLDHKHTPHLEGLPWMRDRPVAETSTWQHTTVTRDKHPYLQLVSNPQSQQASGRKPLL